MSIEFEHKSSDFVRHKHLDKFRKGEKCDYIVCWFDDWEDCPKEITVISLRDHCDIHKEKAPEKIKRLTMTNVDTVICPAKKDGFQTPYIKHGIDVASHLCGICCRGCTERWHDVEQEHELSVFHFFEAIFIFGFVGVFDRANLLVIGNSRHVENQCDVAIAKNCGPGKAGAVFDVSAQRLDHDFLGVVQPIDNHPKTLLARF